MDQKEKKRVNEYEIRCTELLSNRILACVLNKSPGVLWRLLANLALHTVYKMCLPKQFWGGDFLCVLKLLHMLIFDSGICGS